MMIEIIIYLVLLRLFGHRYNNPKHFLKEGTGSHIVGFFTMNLLFSLGNLLTGNLIPHWFTFIPEIGNHILGILLVNINIFTYFYMEGYRDRKKQLSVILKQRVDGCILFLSCIFSAIGTEMLLVEMFPTISWLQLVLLFPWTGGVFIFISAMFGISLGGDTKMREHYRGRKVGFKFT